MTTTIRRAHIVGHEAAGPTGRSSIYSFAGWQVRRQRWVLLVARWGWRAEKDGERTLYADKLEDLAEAIIARARRGA